MNQSSFEQRIQNAGRQYRSLHYQGPALDLSRVPVRPRFRDWRWRVALAGAAILAVAIGLREPTHGPEVTVTTELARQPVLDPYRALAQARSELSSAGFQTPARPQGTYFELPAAPQRPSGFDSDHG